MELFTLFGNPIVFAIIVSIILIIVFIYIYDNYWAKDTKLMLYIKMFIASTVIIGSMMYFYSNVQRSTVTHVLTGGDEDMTVPETHMAENLCDTM